MNESDIYTLLGFIPADDKGTSKEVLVLAYLKNIETNRVLKLEIFKKPTRLPNLRNYPSKYITSSIIFKDVEEAVQAATQHPEETFIIEINQSQQANKKLQIWAKAKSCNMRGMKKEVPEAFNSMSNLKLGKDDIELFHQHTEEIDIDETDVIVEIPLSENLVVINSQNSEGIGETQFDPENNRREEDSQDPPKKVKINNSKNYGTTVNSIPWGKDRGFGNTTTMDTSSNMTGSEIQGNSIENSRHNIDKPTWENYDKYFKNHYDAKSLAVFLTENVKEIRPFEKEGLKEYFDNKTRDRSIFGGRPRRIEEEPAHVREWFEILDNR
ncbi:hypothetical protein Glove_44g12 [Diversispora epigaea]|uniref:Uncharacterized protein n=1 Tax=Diversispora epigaea TaxID=1348612 RepID=A0A397JQR0_9GLOM|nr:hypothetical protein Glove_44g12 [Diversispora epigaea]